ncbi:MAG: LPS export ABC transporter periplasmic protein LptC [Alphaproteobacteria bacterium]
MNSAPDNEMSEAQKRLAELSRRQNRMAAQSERYSKFVRRIRLILPLVAIAIIAALMTWPMQDSNVAVLEEDQQQSLQSIRKNELSNPRFESVDEKNQPYTITASKAVQDSQNESLLLLSEPVGDMLLNSGNWIAIQAAIGHYWQNDKKLFLEQDVRLFHDEGYEMTMDKLDIDLNARTAQSDTQVYGHGPASTIEAQGLRGDNMRGVLSFNGPAKLVLHDAGSLNALGNAGGNDG